MASCDINVNVHANGLDSTERYALMVHEVLHCFQFDLGVIPVHANTPDWAQEGAAERATLSLVPASTTALANFDDWLTKWTRPLWYRSYDGVGVFELLDDVGVDPWTMMDEILLTAANGPDIASRTHAALGIMSARAGDAFLDTWGARHHHRPAIGPAWDFHPKADIGGLTVQPTAFAVAEGDEWSVHVGRFAAFPFAFQPLAEVVETRAIVGGGWVNFDGADSPLSDLVNRPICTLPGGCECTSESPRAGAIFTPVSHGGAVTVGISGGFDDGFAVVTGWKLADWCDQEAVLDPCLVGTWVSTGFQVPGERPVEAPGAKPVRLADTNTDRRFKRRQRHGCLPGATLERAGDDPIADDAQQDLGAVTLRLVTEHPDPPGWQRAQVSHLDLDHDVIVDAGERPLTDRNRLGEAEPMRPVGILGGTDRSIVVQGQRTRPVVERRVDEHLALEGLPWHRRAHGHRLRGRRRR